MAELIDLVSFNFCLMNTENLMPRGPKGEKRPADVIGNAVHVMRVATGEVEDKPSKAPARAKGAKIGGPRRALNLTREQRSESAPGGSCRFGGVKSPGAHCLKNAKSRHGMTPMRQRRDDSPQ